MKLNISECARGIAGVCTKVGVPRWAFGVGIGLVILAITYLFLEIFLDTGWLIVTLALIITFSWYFLKIFRHVAVIVPANWAWLMANPFVTERAAFDPGFSGFREIRAQKEFQAGLHWKYPWEYFSEAIDMKREISVTGNPEENYTMQGGKVIHVEYQIAVVPLPGRLVNFIRTKEEDIKRRVQTRAEKNLQEFFGGLDSADVTFDEAFMEKVQAHFVKTFGGPDVIDPEEEELGIWTGVPEVYDINEVKEVQKGKIFQQKMDSVIAVAKKMVEESNNQLSYQEAYRTALIMEAGAGANVDFVDVSGALAGVFGGKQKQRNNRRNP